MSDDSPRSKVARHARKLMAATAALGVAAVTTRGHADGDVPTPPDASDPDAAPVPVAHPPYQVVDPLPPPARGGCGCSNPGSSNG